MANKSTGLKSIAYDLDISVNTVSRALRDCDDISDATKEKVRQKAYELGYLPNNISQFIKRDGRQLIAIVLNSFRNHYFTIVCEKLVSIASQNKYDFSIIYSQTKKIDINHIKQCISQRVDGIITLLEPDKEAIETCKLNNIPIILVGRNIESDYVDQIYVDDAEGGTIAANYLVNYHKLNKLIYVKMPNVECSKRRQKSFEMSVANLASDGEVLVIDEKEAKTRLLTYINKGYYGIFCFNDELAYEILSNLNENIPNVRKVYPRLHIVGYDCLSTRVDGLIDLTSIDYDYDAICSKAFDILSERLNNIKHDRESIKFPVLLHQRKYF